MTDECRDSSHGFTSIELLASFAACVLLLAVILSALAASRARSDRAVCLGNLRQIGNALRQFALEHDDNPAWSALVGPDGNYNEPGKNELWFQYWWLRDSLGTPKILMDPAETRSGARVATEWDLTLGTGLQSLKNLAVAYGLGVGHFRDSDYQYTEDPRMILALDRNFISSGYGSGSGLQRVSEVRPESTGWYDDIHGVVGNVLFADGSLDSLDTQQLQRAMGRIKNGSGIVRVLNADSW